MNELREKTCVVTGAASGIGHALATAFVEAGARVVLADVDESRLAESAEGLRRAGGDVLAVRTDVARAADVEQLAGRAWETFGAVHVVCNNAGVASDAPLWESSLAEWEWMIGVNLWGVVHGIRAFVPRLLEQGVEAHVVNTASIAGLISEPGLGAYKATKHAVVSLSETLRHELALRRAPIGVSVLCPGFVRTRMADASAGAAPGAPRARVDAAHRQALEHGMAPSVVAQRTLAAIREDRFWIRTHTDWEGPIRTRALDVVDARDPATRTKPQAEERRT
ncbi:MAG: SDR family NAD(P)-dependent oxidoreductase [Planctomycetes bacterium]|nr:SDR family NAD(P)-dependent oxidoreductase [Planctomycetota bacterium]